MIGHAGKVHRALIRVWPATQRANAGAATARHIVDKAKDDLVINPSSAGPAGNAAFDARRCAQEIDVERRAAVNLPRSEAR